MWHGEARRRRRSPISQVHTRREHAVAAISRGLGAVPAPGLVIGGVLGLQCGAALATRLYPAVGPAGVVTLRLCLAAVMLTALWRPGPRWDRSTLGIAAAAGTLLAVHHLSYYEAVERLPLGAATTMEFLGPFAIALFGSRRATDLLWACLAAAGVVLLSRSGIPLNAAGLACGALAGCCWGGYILVGKRLAARVPDGRGLALAVIWGALLSLPYGLAQAGTRLLDPAVLALAAVVAVLSSVLPYTFHLEALRRVPPRVFGVLTSLEPAVGALIGLFLLGQHLAVPQWAGVTAVALAAIGATRTPSRAPKADTSERPSAKPADLTARTSPE
ncbi:EamA family transporter [Streptomyces tubercidicus]|uniref:Membrane protein n=1 Tax=Streptomyces tubercidicus TaxID=47759 RepID=A0A640UXP2_9ACTN|nr:EamA family transporter [Streptomyces tubercidicus]WAU15034.1 EamA family transporter [Streptomyces tubercidicus]GFE40843.1 membrane protein [Streptomyces tubercidicus]